MRSGLLAALAVLAVAGVLIATDTDKQDTDGGQRPAPGPSIRPSAGRPTQIPATPCPGAQATAGATGGRQPVTGVRFDRARQVLQRHRDQIRRRYRGVVGTGIGPVVRAPARRGAGQPIFGVIVFVDRPTHRRGGGEAIDGVPLRFEVTRHYRNLPGWGC